MNPAPSGGTVHLVTGERGAGKTSFCRVLVEEARLRRPGLVVAGVLSPKLFSRGREAGITVVDVASGRHRRLATRWHGGDAGGGPATGRWRFDADALAWGNAVLRSAGPCDLLIVDELGPLEFERGEGWMGGLEAVDAAAYDAAFVVVRPELLERARDRWRRARVIRVGNTAEAEAAARQSALRFALRPGSG